jgi:hypothetical protein
MSHGLSFRAGTALIVGAFAVVAGVLVIGAGRDLEQMVADHAPQVSWMMPETTSVRLAALQAAGRPETAALYSLLVAMSWALISALAAGGFAWGVLNKGDTVLGVDKALSYLAAISALYALATCTEMIIHAYGLSAPQGGIHAIPALWFATMIPSAAILARIGALVAHDAGSLLSIAIAREPKRLAELVATVEATRGAQSVEAKLARLMASRGRAEEL